MITSVEEEHIGYVLRAQVLVLYMSLGLKSSTLKSETVCNCETLVPMYLTALLCHNPEDDKMNLFTGYFCHPYVTALGSV
jgi:hypothetical protein